MPSCFEVSDAVILVLNDQVVELDFSYPSEGVHRRWDSGYRITSTAATWDQAAFVLSIPKRKPPDETQETLRTSAFPSQHVKVTSLASVTRTICNLSTSVMSIDCIVCLFACLQDKWAKNLYISSICYGRTVS